MTQDNIERGHISFKSRILLENYYLPSDVLRRPYRRYHQSLSNLAPADVYFGPGARISRQREEIKRRIITQTPTAQQHPASTR